MTTTKNITRQISKRMIVLFAVVLTLHSFGQNDEKKVMKSFIPKSGTYDIYYPNNFSVQEDKEGIVTISDSVSKLNITVSSQPIESGIDDNKLIERLHEFVRNYFKKELDKTTWSSYETKFGIVVESQFSVDKTSWVWYGIVDKNKLVTISLNKDTTIAEDDLNLIRFMISNLIIFG